MVSIGRTALSYDFCISEFGPRHKAPPSLPFTGHKPAQHPRKGKKKLLLGPFPTMSDYLVYKTAYSNIVPHNSASGVVILLGRGFYI